MVCAEWRRSRAAAVAGLQLHNNRERQHSNTNPDIDRSRSELNYSLIEQNTHNYNKLIDERLHQGYKGKKAIRKDAVKMCEMLFTSDGEFFSCLSEQEQRQFFIDCFEFAAKRYGRENIIAATVHLDEATPHLHLDFVPLTPDGRLYRQRTYWAAERKCSSYRMISIPLFQAGTDLSAVAEPTLKTEKPPENTLKQPNTRKCLQERLAADQQRKAEKHTQKRKELKAKKQAEAEKIISDAKEKAAKELEQFLTYKRWTKDALNEYSEQKKKNDEITQQTDKSKERLSEVQNQITSAEQERDRVRQETESLNRTMEQLTQNQDDRYCSFQIELSVFGKLMETAQEYHVAVRTEHVGDGETVIVKTPISEKKYLALSIEKARKLVPPPTAFIIKSKICYYITLHI